MSTEISPRKGMPAAPGKGNPLGEEPPGAGEGKENYRGGLFDQIDIPAVASLLGCALIFVLLLVGVKSLDYSSLNKPSLEDLPDRVAKILMPLKPPGKTGKKPKAAALQGADKAKKSPSASSSPADHADARARIERSRKTVDERIGKIQERVTKAAVLSILSGKGPGTRGTAVGRKPAGGGFADWGDLDANLGKLEGLTKFDAKKGSVNQDGAPPGTRDGPAAATSGIDKLVKGFQNAKVSALAKIGVAELERPALLEGSSKYTGNRSLADIAAFIYKKQASVSMLYEERLKSNPALEGKVTVVLVIEEDGAVSSATTLKNETTLDDSDFIADLLRRVRRWIFPPSSGGPVEMKSPFIFKPA